MDRDKLRSMGEIRERTGLAIINPHGGIWADPLFETPEKARAYLKREYPEADAAKFKLAMATQITELYRASAEPEFIPMPLI